MYYGSLIIFINLYPIGMLCKTAKIIKSIRSNHRWSFISLFIEYCNASRERKYGFISNFYKS